MFIGLEPFCRRCTLLLVTALTAASLTACAAGGAPPVPAGKKEAAQRALKVAAKAAKPIAISKLIANVKSELDAMGEIWKLDYETGKLLGTINGRFQLRSYYSRIPTGPAVSGIESNIRQLASHHALIVENFQARVPRRNKLPKAVVLKPGDRWMPKREQLFATIRLEIDLQGSVQAAAKMIDEFPTKLERLVVVTGEQPRPGGVTLFAECWYEWSVPMPKIELPWPELDERLIAAGWNPRDPKVINDPQVAQLRELVVTGRKRMVDVRNTLAVAADFPRWFLRNEFFDEKSLAAQAVNGTELLGTIQR